ncbi:hypothetical protein ACFCX4_16290 [Kitasatospora sp. NPDC056327]|uniref:hypothetical protein n=1 Tax=Kitasatospora sp. NPDC056327 TaxID=3345785 RepID=UPI0035DDCB53
MHRVPRPSPVAPGTAPAAGEAARPAALPAAATARDEVDGPGRGAHAGPVGP